MPSLRRAARTRHRRLAPSLALLVCLASSEVAAAELTVDEPIGCVTREELSFRAERALGQALDTAAPLALRIAALPGGEGAGHGARLDISEAGAVTASGSRSFHAASCDELLDQLALAVALALGSRSDEASARPAGTEGAASDAAASEPARAEPAASAVEGAERPASVDATVPEDERRGPRLGVRAGLVADTGTLPRAALGVALGAGLAWPALELRLMGTFVPERESRLDASDPGSPGAELGLLAGSVGACAPLGASGGRVALQLCAGWELGQLSGHGTRVDDPHQTRAWWSAPRVDLGASWPNANGPIALELLVSAFAPLTRDEFILKDIGSVHRPANVVGRAALGVRWQIE